MSTAITASHIQREPVLPRQTVVATGGSTDNGWLFQEITTRLPGRGLDELDVATLTELLQEAEKRHGDYEPTAPKHHWSAWYATYIVARQHGETLEEAAKDGKFRIEGER
jgi:hypothetical protein